MRIDVVGPCVNNDVGTPRCVGGRRGHEVWDDTVCVCDGEVERPVCPPQLCRRLLVLLWQCWGGGCECGGLMAQWGRCSKRARRRGKAVTPEGRRARAECPVPSARWPSLRIPYRSAAATA